MVNVKDKRLLFLIREMLNEARTIVSGNYPADYSLLKAVWLADLAAELTLATVITDYNLSSRLTNQKNPLFEDYIKAIKDSKEHPELKALELYFASLHSLHKARNGVHNAVANSHTSSQKLVQTATNFIHTVFADIYNFDIESLSLTSFLHPSPARDRLERVELKMAEQNYEEAMLEVARALELGRRQFSKLLREKQGSGLWSEELFPSTIELPRKVSIEERGIKKIAYFLELSRYGIDIDKAIRYSERVPEVIGFSEEALVSASGIVRGYSQQEAQEFLDFVADALYRFQSYSDKF